MKRTPPNSNGMLKSVAWSLLLLVAGSLYAETDDAYAPSVVRSAMDEQQRKIIDYFYTGAHPTTGMAFNHNTVKSILTTGATGFGVMAIIAGVERGWIDRAVAAGHIVKIVRFLKTVKRYEGAWSHWYSPDGRTVRFGNQVDAGEIVETAFLLGGLLTACEYFDRDNEAEKEIRETTTFFGETVNWRHYVHDGKFYWIWHADKNEYELPIVGWNECLLVYILAMAAPEPHNVPPSVYRSCWQGYRFAHPGRKTYGYPLPLGTNQYGSCLFLSQYSFLGLDPRRMRDEFACYWTQNLGHTMINRHYCVHEAPSEYKYSELDWGLTACGGCSGRPGYKARAPFDDDGVLAPTAAISAFPYTPFYSTQVLLNLKKNFPELDGEFGFGISYCPKDHQVNKEYLAIEQAPMAIMMENYRSGLLWNLLMKNENVRKGLQLAGMKTEPDHPPGFYLAMLESETQVYDMMRHPDRERYEIDFYSKSSGKGTLQLDDAQDKTIYDTEIDLVAGTNLVSFQGDSIERNGRYRLTVTDARNSRYSIFVNLR